MGLRCRRLAAAGGGEKRNRSQRFNRSWASAGLAAPEGRKLAASALALLGSGHEPQHRHCRNEGRSAGFLPCDGNQDGLQLALSGDRSHFAILAQPLLSEGTSTDWLGVAMSSRGALLSSPGTGPGRRCTELRQ